MLTPFITPTNPKLPNPDVPLLIDDQYYPKKKFEEPSQQLFISFSRCLVFNPNFFFKITPPPLKNKKIINRFSRSEVLKPIIF